MDPDDPGPSSARPPCTFGHPISSQTPPHDSTTEFDEDEDSSPSSASREAFCSRTTFFVNADWRMGSTLANATTIVGQMYVERLDPVKKLQPYPIILIHGDFHTGQMAKPDGNPGWASYFVRRGFQVYVVDLPPCGRSNFLTAAHFIHRDLSRVSHTLAASVVENELTAPGKEPAHGQPLVPLRHSRAGLHSKWPGTGQRGDPIFTNYCASLVTLHLNKIERQSLGQNAIRALLHKTGKAVLVGEGSGGNMSWLANDVAPDLVAGVVAVEPAGPPFGTAMPKNGQPRVYTQFIQLDKGNRLYGLTDIPLTYDPPTHPHDGFERPARDPLDIARALRPDRLGACFMQQKAETDIIEVGSDGKPLPGQQVRQLIHLKKVPHALITAHASSHTVFDWATVAYMKQAGVAVDWLRLEDFEIIGNGHLMFLETNSDEVAGVIERWIQKKVTTGSQVASPTTSSESRSMVTSENGRAKKSEQSGNLKAISESTPVLSSTGSIRNSESAPHPLPGNTPQVQVQNQKWGPRAGFQSSGPGQLTQDNGKRPAEQSISGRAAASETLQGIGIRPESPSTQEQKRRCLGQSVKSSSMPMSTASGTFPIPQLTQQQHIRAFQNMQGQVHGRSNQHPPHEQSMMRSPNLCGPSQLRQQLQPITGAGPTSPYHATATFPPIARPSTPQGTPLYAHLSGDAQHASQSSGLALVAATESESAGHLPRVFRHITFSDESIKALASTPPHRIIGNPEPTPGSSAHFIATAVRQQLDSLGQPRMNGSLVDPRLSQVSTPTNQQTSPRHNNVQITPSGHGNMDFGGFRVTEFGMLPAMTPPSPSPAPRPLVNQMSSNDTGIPPAEEQPTAQ
ncbi:Alpha/beta hydrolase family-domain-containing protein [Ilyonectria sp. MPI-CAGE-AT-0026]|nr:Alpha/beta hydrolase family-domain-containing protein [Ilyonectria sp. MPI-CAGE-AT-0026]